MNTLLPEGLDGCPGAFNWWEPCVCVSLKKFYGFFLVLLVTRSLGGRRGQLSHSHSPLSACGGDTKGSGAKFWKLWVMFHL